MVLKIVIGLIVWLVVPPLSQSWVKRANIRKAVAMLCKILGIVIIIMAVWGEIKLMFN